MTEKQNIKIILFTGLSGSGKSTATDYVTTQSIPKVTCRNIRETLSEIQNLIDAGQHKLVIDGIESWTDYIVLKKHFPGSITCIALLSDRHVRQRRLAQRAHDPETEQAIFERDMNAIENENIGGVIAMADHSILNNNSLEQLYKEVDDLLDQVGFFTD